MNDFFNVHKNSNVLEINGGGTDDDDDDGAHTQRLHVTKHAVISDFTALIFSGSFIRW